MFSRIRHIFPYLYYRFYQYVYQKGGEKWNPELRAFGFVCVIKNLLLFSFVGLPLMSKLSDDSIIYIISFMILIVSLLRKNTHKKYREMMPLWENESESQRKYKDIFLIFFCVFAIFSFIPVFIIMDLISLMI